MRLHIYISALRTNKRNKNLIHISAFLVRSREMPCLVLDTTVTARLHIYISALRTNKRNKNLIDISAFLVGRCHLPCLVFDTTVNSHSLHYYY